MRNWFADLPVQRKLGYAMLLTSTVALTLACVVFLALEYIGDRRNLEQTISTLAKITSNNSSAAIAFGDRTVARQNIEAPSAEPQIIAATLYDANGQVIARYRSRTEESIRTSATAEPGLRFEQGRLVVVQSIISDVGLPDRSGYELMADLRSRFPDLRGIALSGYGMEEDLQRSQAAGFVTHLVNPITIGMLEDAIAGLPPAAETVKPGEDVPAHP